MEHLERIIAIQQEQLNRANEYILCLLNSKRNGIKNDKHIEKDIFESISNNYSYIDHNDLKLVFDAPYPAIDQISDFIKKLIKDDLVNYIFISKLDVQYIHNDEIISSSFTEFSHHICIYIFDLIIDWLKNEIKFLGDNIEIKDENRLINNSSCLKLNLYQEKIMKIVISK